MTPTAPGARPMETLFAEATDGGLSTRFFDVTDV
jgi:hypothetical protein